jgi:plasmid stability protein
MGNLTIRDLDDSLKQKLREKAASQGFSMERSAREILTKGATPHRRKPILEELRKLGAKPSEPFDLKKISDEMWEEGLR